MDFSVVIVNTGCRIPADAFSIVMNGIYMDRRRV